MQREHDIEADHKTFRLCINKVDNERLLVANKWPADIVVSKWFFKKTTDTNTSKAAATQGAAA